MKPYTPTTGDFRETYLKLVSAQLKYVGITNTKEAGERYDRMIQEQRRQAWNEGAVSLQKPLQEGEPFARRMEIQSLVAAHTKFVNPYGDGN